MPRESNGGGLARGSVDVMIKPYRFAFAVSIFVDHLADLIPVEDAETADACRKFAEVLRRYAGPEDPPKIEPIG